MTANDPMFVGPFWGLAGFFIANWLGWNLRHYLPPNKSKSIPYLFGAMMVLGAVQMLAYMIVVYVAPFINGAH